MRLISPTGNSNRARRREAERSRGFVLIDVLAVLAITVLMLAMAWPAIPHGTTYPRLTAIAVELATFLKTSRTDAVASGRETLTVIDRGHRTITSGDHVLTLPNDVDLSVLAADSCSAAGASTGIVFRPDGTSCGAVIRITRNGRGYRLRINWYTGHVAILKA